MMHIFFIDLKAIIMACDMMISYKYLQCFSMKSDIILLHILWVKVSQYVGVYSTKTDKIRL